MLLPAPDLRPAPYDLRVTSTDFDAAPNDLRDTFSLLALQGMVPGVFDTTLLVLLDAGVFAVAAAVAVKFVFIFAVEVTFGTNGTPTCGDLNNAVRDFAGLSYNRNILMSSPNPYLKWTI